LTANENGGFEFIIKTAVGLCYLFTAAKNQLPQLRFFLFTAGQVFNFTTFYLANFGPSWPEVARLF